MKKTVLVLLVLLVFLGLGSVTPSAEEFSAYLINYDQYVYSGGYMDVYAGSGLTDDSEVTYRWCGKYGWDGTFVELDDNERYKGTHTSHFRFLTGDGYAYGTDWEKLHFACKITYKGKTLYTEDMWMHIGSSAALTADLERNPITITSFYKNGGASDGDRFTAKAGEKFTLTRTYSPVETNFRKLLTASEMEPKLFVTVTENGTTTAYEADRGYTPYAVGKGAVTAKAELYLMVNGVKERLLDSKTIVIDTYAGDTVGSAKAKVSGSLLREMYPESAKVDPAKAVMQKGQWVSLLSQNGSWWLVSSGGFVGYVPASSLDISKTVEEVSLSVSEPADGASPSFDPVIETGSVALFPTEPVTWQRTDLSGMPYIYANDRFLAGKQYRLVIWLKVLPGYRFPLSGGKPDVRVLVNGRTAAVRTAYEQDPEEVLELSVDYADHVHNPVKVNQVNPTCVKDGKLTYYHCSCGADFEDYQGKVRITDANWGILPARGHWESPWQSNGAEHYKTCQRRECMAEIPGSRGKHHGGTATCYAAAVCTDCSLEYGSLAPHIPGPAPTAKSPQVCQYCGTILNPALGHQHDMTEIPAKEATCMEAGNKAYFVCRNCGKWYWEQAGVTEISNHDDVTAAPLGHETSEEWKHDREYHWRVCVRCEEVLDETKMLHDENGENGACATCGYAPSEPESEETEPASDGAKDSTAENAPFPADGSETHPAGSLPPENEQEKTIFGLTISWFLVLIALSALLLGAVAVIIVLLCRQKKKQGKQGNAPENGPNDGQD